MLIVLRPEAEEEFVDAQAWYESKALGLGFEFARAADAAVASALRNPFGHFRIEEKFRRVQFRKFPYTLFYLPSPMSCWWFHSFISTVNRAFGLSGLVAEGIISCDHYSLIPHSSGTRQMRCVPQFER